MNKIITSIVLLFSLYQLTFGLDLGICDGRVSQNVSYGKVNSASQENDNLPTLEMMIAAGYTCAEAHDVTTEDGYILTMHRIKGGRVNSCPQLCNSCHDQNCDRRPVVFLQHDFLGSSADWVMQDPTKSLGYLLADRGYDVWMGNFRGNTNSRRHVSLNPERNEFWQFSYDEMAKYDLPTMLTYALEVSCEGDLLFVGHGLGTTTFMAMHHYHPEVADFVRLANFLSPMAYMSHMKGPISWIASQEGALELFFNLFGWGELLPSNLIMDCLASAFCPHTDDGTSVCDNHENFCSNIIFLLSGFDCAQQNVTLVDRIMHHTPAGTSSVTLLHYLQGIKSGEFQGYDWGNEHDNILHHGMSGVPTYKLWDVNSPIALYVAGDNDWMAQPEDTIQTTNELPFVVPGMIHQVEYEKWAHVDFVFGIDAKQYVYDDVIANLLHCAYFIC